MASGSEGDNMLVRMSGVVRLCCSEPATTLLAPPAPSRDPLPEDPRRATGLWDGFHPVSVFTSLYFALHSREEGIDGCCFSGGGR